MSSSRSQPSERCLFSAPFAFIPGVEAAYRAVLPTEFREIWRREEVTAEERATVWVVNPGQSFVVDRAVLERFPRLRLLVTPSTGLNHIGGEACRAGGVTVRSLLDDRQGLETISASAEFTFLLLLGALRRPDLGSAEVRARRWRQREDLLRGFELQGKTVGLVGLGRIGRRLARYCQAFDATTIYYDPYVSVAEPERARSLEDLFRACDVVCVCCALTEETRGLIHGGLLRLLKPDACLVNTSRGEVIDMADLHALLRQREDLRVALDVLPGEVAGEHLDRAIMALHDDGRLMLTPHIAGATVESQAKAAMIALEHVKRFFRSEGTSGDA